MNGRALLIWVLGALVVDLATDNPVFRGLVVLVAIDLLLLLAPRGRSIRPTLLAVVVFGATAVALNLVLSHTGEHVLFRLPDWLPLLGGPLTLESLAYGCAAGLGIGGAVLAVAPISLVLEPHELIDALPRHLERSGLAVATALNLVPGIGRNAVAIHDAERMRGWRPRGVRSWSEILVPTILTSLEDALALAEAMEARAYGVGVRTTYAIRRWDARDVVSAAAALVAAAAFIGARLAGVALDWQPYPALSLPPLSPILVAAALLLACPVLPWPSRPSLD